MPNSDFRYLFQQFFSKKATTQESEEFLSLLKKDEYNEELQVLLDRFWEETTSKPKLHQDKAEMIFNKIMAAGTAVDLPPNKAIRSFI